MTTRRWLPILLITASLGIAGGCSQSPSNAPAPTPPAGGPPMPAPGAPPSAALDMNQRIRMLQDLLRTDPKNVNALIDLGNQLMDTGRYAEAADAYGKSLEITPDNVNVRVDMGTCLRNVGQAARAAEEYRKGLSYDPNHANALLNLGVVLAFDLNDRKSAEEVWKKFLEIAPGHPMANQIRQEMAKSGAK